MTPASGADRLARGMPVQVVWLEGAADRRAAGARAAPARLPRADLGARRRRPAPDRRRAGARASRGTVTLIGRGAVHVFERAEGLTGAVLRFGDELLASTGARRPAGCSPGAAGGRSRCPPAPRRSSRRRLRAVAAEAERPPDPYSADLLRHLVATVLLWVERWYDAVADRAARGRRRRGAAAPPLHRRARARLPRAPRRRATTRTRSPSPPAALSRALARSPGARRRSSSPTA